MAQLIGRRTGMREAWVRIPEAEREGSGDGKKRRWVDNVVENEHSRAVIGRSEREEILGPIGKTF